MSMIIVMSSTSRWFNNYFWWTMMMSISPFKSPTPRCISPRARTESFLIFTPSTVSIFALTTSTSIITFFHIIISGPHWIIGGIHSSTIDPHPTVYMDNIDVVYSLVMPFFLGIWFTWFWYCIFFWGVWC